MSFEHLWQPLRVGSVDVRNRVFVSGHTTNFRVHPTTFGRSSTIAGYLPESLPGFRRLVEAVQAEGARIFAQLEQSVRGFLKGERLTASGEVVETSKHDSPGF